MIINRLPTGGGGSDEFEITPWFVKGELFNTDVFGVPNFYHQQNGTVNSDTYQTDGYIYANYTSTGYCSVFVTTDNYVPKTYDFALFRIRHIRIASSNYGLGFGTTNTRSDMSRMSYRWGNTNADNDYWLTIPLDVYNSLSANEYLSIGGASEFYIYEIYLVKAAS